MTSGPASLAKPAARPSAAPGALRVEIADSPEACRRLREPWLQLRQRSGVQAPETDPDRFLAVAQALGDARPYVVAFGPPECPRALIVARSSRRRAAHRLGYVKFRTLLLRCLDVVYEGLLTDGQPDSLRMAIDYLAGLLARGGVDLVSFNHLRSDQADQMAAVAPRAVFDRAQLHWRFELVPGSFDATLRTFSKKRRNELDREGRRLADHFAGRLRVDVLGSVGELDRIFEQAGRIIARTYHARIPHALADTPVWRAQLALEARRGALRAFFLLGGDDAIAFNIGSIYGSVLILDALAHLPEYNRFSPGKHLLLRVFERCCAEGLARVDYGFGDGDYKRIYGTASWTEQSVRLYGRTPRATAAWAMDLAATRGAAWLYAVADRLGVARRLKNAWRRRMARDGA